MARRPGGGRRLCEPRSWLISAIGTMAEQRLKVVARCSEKLQLGGNGSLNLPRFVLGKKPECLTY